MDDFKAFFQQYKWRIIAVCAGVVLSILFFTIGFWRTLLLLVIVAACYFIGMLLDAGDRGRVKDAFDTLFKK